MSSPAQISTDGGRGLSFGMILQCQPDPKLGKQGRPQKGSSSDFNTKPSTYQDVFQQTCFVDG